MICTVADYRRITGDNASDGANVTDALVEAQNLVEDKLNRSGILEVATRTEEVKVYNLIASIYFIAGLAYPQATPIVTVISPGGLTWTRSEIRGITGTTFDLVTDLISEFPKTTITYTGGYDTVTVPSVIRRAICRVAQVGINAPVPVFSGAQSVRVGDVQVTYRGAPSADAAIQAILDDPLLTQYTRRRPIR